METKSFEFRSNVQGGVQLAEKSRGKVRPVIMSWHTIFWLVSAWDYMTKSEMVRKTWRMFRFGCLGYVVQRRHNSFGNFLELSEYGGKGRRSFVIIQEGIEGNGWEACRVQLQRLKLHYEKQGERNSSFEAQVGKKTVGQKGGGEEEKLPVGITYAAAVVGEKAIAGETQIAGEGVSNLKGTKSTAVVPGDHIEHQSEILAPQYQGVNMQGLKERLVCLQKEISSCLQKLEMGWAIKESDVLLAQGRGKNVLKNGEQKEDGPSLRAMDEPKSTWKKPIIRFY